MNAHHPPGADSLAAYVLQASTQNLRGRGCSFVEKAQLAAWRASDDQKRDVTLAAYRQIHAGYACFDAPRKCPITVVRSQCYELLKTAGLGTSSLKFSDYIQTTYMSVDLRVNRKRSWACLGGVPHGLSFGQVWLPGGHSHEHGAAVVRHAPRELLRYVAHQLRPQLDNSFRATVQRGDVEALVAVAGAASAGPHWAERDRFAQRAGQFWLVSENEHQFSHLRLRPYMYNLCNKQIVSKFEILDR